MHIIIEHVFLINRVKPYLRMNEMIKTFERQVYCEFWNFFHYLVIYRLSLRKCKGFGEKPTFNISEDHFIAPAAVIFSKVVNGAVIKFGRFIAIILCLHFSHRSLAVTLE